MDCSYYRAFYGCMCGNKRIKLNELNQIQSSGTDKIYLDTRVNKKDADGLALCTAKSSPTMELTLNYKQGPDSIYRCRLISIGNPSLEIRRSLDRLISTMGFAALVRWHFILNQGPGPCLQWGRLLTGDEIFWLWGLTPCLLMPWPLEVPGHQQAWYQQYRIGNM